jgi:hypothetical protein
MKNDPGAVFVERALGGFGEVACFYTGPVESATSRGGAGPTLREMSPTWRERAVERRVRTKPGQDHPEEPAAIDVKYAITASVLPSATMVSAVRCPNSGMGVLRNQKIERSRSRVTS